MKIETLTFFRTHLQVNDRRELFPVINFVLDQNYSGLSEAENLNLRISTERTDFENVPIVFFHAELQVGDLPAVRKTKTIDYTSEQTVHFFEDVFSGDPFLFAFSTVDFLNGKTKEFQYRPAYSEEEAGKLARWDIELAYTDSTSRNLEPGTVTGTLEKWWKETGMKMNEAQDQHQ